MNDARSGSTRYGLSIQIRPKASTAGAIAIRVYITGKMSSRSNHNNDNTDSHMNCFSSSSSTVSHRTPAMIQQCIQDRLDVLKGMTESHKKIVEDMYRLAQELQELTESKDEPSFRRYIGVEARHLARLAHDAKTAFYRFDSGIQYVRRCVDLRRNDPQITWADSENYTSVRYESPVRFGSIIGDCLKYNSHVTGISVRIEDLLGEDDDARQRKTNVKAALQYIEKSSVLCRLRLMLFREFPRHEDYVSMFLKATKRNHHITELDCSSLNGSSIPCAAFCELLSQSKSITTLSICCSAAWEAFTNSTARSVVATRPWRIAPSLVNLRLCDVNMNLTHAINFLESGHAHLEKLTLEGCSFGGDQDFTALLQFLPRTTTLQHLEFYNFEFGTDDVNCICDGLLQHYTMELATYVTKLSFLRCLFMNDDAAIRFLEFFQTPSSNLHEAACLEELSVDIRGSELIGIPIGSFIASLVTMHATSCGTMHRIQQERKESSTHCDTMEYCQTVGSKVKVLALPSECTTDGFWDTMVLNANGICVTCLHLTWYGDADNLELSKCVPNLLSLKELHLVPTTIYAECLHEDHDGIVDMVKQSGNLHVVTVRDNKSCVLNDTQVRLVESFCQRNMVLSKIQSREIRWADTMSISRIDSSDALPQHKKFKPGHHDSIPIVIMPAILQVAKQTPLTVVSMIMSSLLPFGYA